MILLTLSMCPRGDIRRSYPLGRMVIANRGRSSTVQGSGDPCDYDVVIAKSAAMTAKSPGVWKSCKVIGYPRASRRVGVWDLLRSALDGCLGNREQWETKPLAAPDGRKLHSAMEVAESLSPKLPAAMQRALMRLAAARIKVDEKYGDESLSKGRAANDPLQALGVLTEEFLELTREVLDHGSEERILEELTDLGQVVGSWIEALQERGRGR